MASVFGVPVSVDTLKATALYEEPITQRDLADYAMMMMNDGRDADAQHFLDNLKERYGNGISAKCLIYNATGTALNFVTNKNWHGHIGDTPYPSVIHNGQWGAYLHVHQSFPPAGSEGAVVYRCKVPSSSDSCDWLLCWGIPYVGNNGVYTEIREKGHFPQHWDYIYHKKLECADRSSTDSRYGYVSNTQIGEGTTVDVRAVFQLA